MLKYPSIWNKHRDCTSSRIVDGFRFRRVPYWIFYFPSNISFRLDMEVAGSAYTNISFWSNRKEQKSGSPSGWQKLVRKSIYSCFLCMLKKGLYQSRRKIYRYHKPKIRSSPPWTWQFQTSYSQWKMEFVKEQAIFLWPVCQPEILSCE